MNNLISVIVPVYNVEKYLDKCINSIVNQTYKNLEIILVDDGSTDNSGKMCDDFAKQDSRIRVFHKENGGQCTARNLALDNAEGDYIAFVDSDDFISENMLELLLSDLLTYNADISSCSSTSEDKTSGSGAVSAYENKEAVKLHLSDFPGLGHSTCDKLYKRELFTGVRFPAFRAYEDCATIYKLLFKCRKIVYRDMSFYHYIPRANSTMTQSFSLVKFQQIEAYFMMLGDYEKHYPEYSAPVKEKLIGSCQYCIGETYKLKRQKEYKDEVKKARNILKGINYDGLSPKLKITKFLMTVCPKLFGLLYLLRRQ